MLNQHPERICTKLLSTLPPIHLLVCGRRQGRVCSSVYRQSFFHETTESKLALVLSTKQIHTLVVKLYGRSLTSNRLTYWKLWTLRMNGLKALGHTHGKILGMKSMKPRSAVYGVLFKFQSCNRHTRRPSQRGNTYILAQSASFPRSMRSKERLESQNRRPYLIPNSKGLPGSAGYDHYALNKRRISRIYVKELLPAYRIRTRNYNTIWTRIGRAVSAGAWRRSSTASRNLTQWTKMANLTQLEGALRL